MSKYVSYAKKFLNKEKRKTFFLSKRYLKYQNKYPIDDNLIFLEAQQSETIMGNVYYILKELLTNNNYKDYKVVISAKESNKEEFEKLLDTNNIKGFNIVVFPSAKYYKMLATAKYIITDAAIRDFFCKRDGQIFLNTWHGTPLKHLGRKMTEDSHKIGNVQKNFSFSDYVLVPNDFTKECFLNDYMIKNISNATFLHSEYPRCEAFYDEAKKDELLAELNLKDKTVFAYLPTWRESSLNGEGSLEKYISLIKDYLKKLDSALKDDQVLMVNFHIYLNSKIDFSDYSRIVEFPKNHETYEILNLADCLITDYSSVLFDYVATEKKIILFAYDEEEYLENRGMYFDIRSLPFPVVKDIDSLVSEMNSEKNYDDEAFIKEYCSYRNSNSTKNICEQLIMGQSDIHADKINLEKQNVLVYADGLMKKNKTDLLFNFLENSELANPEHANAELANAGLEGKNYVVSFKGSSINDKNIESIKNLPESVDFYAIKGVKNFPIAKYFTITLFKLGLMSADSFVNKMKKSFRDELKRMYGVAKFDKVIHSSGENFIEMFLLSELDSKHAIIVNDEIESIDFDKKSCIAKALEYVFKHYDEIIVTDEAYLPIIEKYSGDDTRVSVMVGKNDLTLTNGDFLN